MKAVQIERFGGPEILQAIEIPAPEPQDSEILLKIEAAGVNRVDLLTRRGIYHRGGQPPMVLGVEGSGVVHRVGARVRDIEPGQRVFAFGGRPGFYAEYVAVPKERVVPTPENLDSASAAALPTAWLSAWYCLIRLARLEPGSRVLVYAAASGVGDAAVQIAKHLGGEVIAVAGSEEKVAWTLSNGADHGIDYSQQDVVSETLSITAGAGVDVVLDAVGGSRFAEALKVTSHGGRVITLANVALEESRVDTRDFYPKNVSIHGFQITNLMQHLGYDPRKDLEQLASLVAEGELDLHIDKVFPLVNAADAHRYLEGRHNRGKVVLVPATEPMNSKSR